MFTANHQVVSQMFRKGPLLLSKEFLKEIRGLKVSNYRRVDVRFDQQPRGELGLGN